MAPIKFEDNLKEKLEKRTIQPSSHAWNRLENRLVANSGKKSSKRFWVLGLAASITGFFLVTTFYFKTEVKPIDNEIKVVQENPAIKEQLIIQTNITSGEKKQEPESLTEKTSIESTTQIASETNFEKKPVLTEKVVEQPINEDLVQTAETPQKLERFKNYEDTKVNEVVAQVQELVKKNQSVTQLEIDSLLTIAQQDLNQQKIYNQTTGKVDAMALLADVENDLDKSFRDKVFEALYSGIENVATAIVQRNE